MIDKRLVPYSGLKKEPFSGSHNGMRYMMRSDNGRDSTTFTVLSILNHGVLNKRRKIKLKVILLTFPKKGLIWRSHGCGSGLKPNVTVGRRHHRK